MKLDPSRFEEWFRALNGFDPFPWQRRMFRKWLCPQPGDHAHWPRLVRLPTAAGKTTLIDLAVLALAAGSPCARRRVVFVVDRRVVVDEAGLHARATAERLKGALVSPGDPLYDVARSLLSLGGEEPLVVATLRGGIPEDDRWARSPVQPAVVLSTVDQAGSRLLFRAYGGHGPRSWPIHAGLIGRDTVIIIDEAHCANPFCQTVRAIAERWQNFAERPVGESIVLVRMSATPAEEPDFTLEPEDRADRLLGLRLRASKPAELKPVEARGEDHRAYLVQQLAERAEGLVKQMSSGAVGIVVNRVADARAVFERLNIPADRKILLTGRVRGWERDRLLRTWLPRLRAGAREQAGEPLAVVATQCIEVGANLDFDALVTEAASLDALRQRFGRLNRLGERPSARAVIVATTRQIEQDDDRVYGPALSRTWAWLKERAQGEPPCVDFGVDALEAILPAAEELSALCMQVREAYPLLPAHLDLLAQTNPPPEPEPELSAFLHGAVTSSPDVAVVWRCDLPEDEPGVWADRAAMQPPVTGESCPVPVWEFRRWLSATPRLEREDAGDIEAAAPGEETHAGVRRVLRWRGPADAEVVPASEVRPGDTVVVPSTYGGCDQFGWNPASVQPVLDIGDEVAFRSGRRLVLRLELLKALLSPNGADGEAATACEDLSQWAARDEDAPEVACSLARLAALPDLPGWLRELARSLAAERRCRQVEASGAYAITGRRSSGEDFSTVDDGSSLGIRVSLADHSAGVRNLAGRFARAAGLPEPLVSDLALAGWLHDVGKADPRFQAWLYGGDEVAAELAEKLLAKSGLNPRGRAAIRRARQQSRYPENARHEVQSLALIAEQQQIQDLAHDWELVQHLVASSHGFARPFVPVAPDPEPVLVALAHGSLELARGSDHSLYRIDSGVAERYWRLVRRYGWWGLAWLEAILRLADHRRSVEEERGEVECA